MMRLMWITFLILSALSLKGKDIPMLKNDSLGVVIVKNSPELFYDSLAMKASRHKVTKWLYNWVICTENQTVNGDLSSYEYYKTFENKTIGSISIKSLDVFGPDFTDTAKITNIWLEKWANKLHSKSNLYVIRKNLWIKEGQELDPDLIMDNERLLRSLPYLKDVRIIIKPHPFNDNMVDILILTKDVFSLGISGNIGSINKGEIGIYDKNILGVGHEIGTKLIAHTDLTPHIGFEAYYAINNVKGGFFDFSAGYTNTYLREGMFFSFERDFLRPQSVYAGGLTFLRSFRSDRINLSDHVLIDYPLDYLFLDTWYGRRLKRATNPNDSRFQINISGRVRYTSFYDRPQPDNDGNQFFANSTFYLGSLSFSRRSYVRDYLIYSYGITEDIPKGYLHELVFGYDHNEFGDRWYSHLYLSTGNLFKNKPFYFFTSFGLGTFWKPDGAEQGMADLKINYISPLFQVWRNQSRQFIKLNYTLGINRFEIEDLLLRNSDGIRGFGSRIGKGKQRLTLNVENVFFQKRSILNFQTAFFSFFDAGIVGPANESIFKQSYYAGLGLGLRIRNENLIFKTIQIRLAYYPNHPSDVSSIGFILDEVSKNRFYSFQPRGPEPLSFE
ncbi:MAG: hypothetical protein K0M50_22670 [Prolixibacteraceae bacterium]|nr:hypothetical protein [Prolixibacteraceae bacterium]